jgi:hypothetical protein
VSEEDERMTLDDDYARRMRAEAEEIYEAEQAGVELPPIDPATVSMPTFAASKVVPVRLTEEVYEAIVAIAAEKGTEVSSVIRAAVSRYLS